MKLTSLDTLLWMAGILGEVSLSCVLLMRKHYRDFPLFVSWVIFNTLSEALVYILIHHASALTYYKAYFVESIALSTLELCVLLEIAANVLRPVKRSLPAGILVALLILMVGIGAGGFWIAAHLNAATLLHPRALIVLNTTIAILRLVTFVVIAGFSQVLGLGWKNHVLQLTTGLAFYAFVTLAVELVHSHLRAGPDFPTQYARWDHLRILSYLCALYYWSYAFLRKEAPRKEFNSKMSEFLISISAFPKQQQSIVARKHR
ncbi:hypothetical protein [Silvibacterium sp.]|uniref:hypothetical protein n=1 Tax=Silvibacterium sp. TaxID=1964179 RepID=UPI0039E5FBC4